MKRRQNKSSGLCPSIPKPEHGRRGKSSGYSRSLILIVFETKQKLPRSVQTQEGGTLPHLLFCRGLRVHGRGLAPVSLSAVLGLFRRFFGRHLVAIWPFSGFLGLSWPRAGRKWLRKPLNDLLVTKFRSKSRRNNSATVLPASGGLYSAAAFTHGWRRRVRRFQQDDAHLQLGPVDDVFFCSPLRVVVAEITGQTLKKIRR